MPFAPFVVRPSLHRNKVASQVGVRQFVVPGSTVEDSREALGLAREKPNVRQRFKTHSMMIQHVERLTVVANGKPSGFVTFTRRHLRLKCEVRHRRTECVLPTRNGLSSWVVNVNARSSAAHSSLNGVKAVENGFRCVCR